MSAALFDINLVRQRLTDLVTDLQTIEGAAEYAQITELRQFRPPCAYVLPVRERGDGEPAKGGRQRALVQFGVVAAVRNYRDTRGAETLDELGPLIGKIRDALIGWTPAVAGARPCQWLQGDVLDFDDSTLLYSNVFQTQMFIGRPQ